MAFLASTMLARAPFLSLPEARYQFQGSLPPFALFRKHKLIFQTLTSIRASSGGSPGVYSFQTFELTPENVDMVLDDVRPYLISDGGNVEVVSVEDGVISLRLQGACGSCPSSTTTMKMGIERVLQEKFGAALKDIRQVNDEPTTETTVEAVNGYLDILRPAIKSYAGSVDVLSIHNGECLVKYTGPDSIGSGIEAAIKERFPDIFNVVLTDERAS